MNGWDERFNSLRSKFALESGRNSLSMVDLDDLLNDPKDVQATPICSAVVGCNNQIAFNEESNRLAILSDFEKVRLMPMLHHNTMQFRDMEKRSEYLFGRQIKDRFTAVTKEGSVS